MNTTLTFILLTAGIATERELQAALGGQRQLQIVTTSESVEIVYQETLRWQPSAVILTLGNNPRVVWDLSRRIHSACPETLIICASPQPTPEMILESLRAGACEFLRLPIIAEELKTVLERVELFSAGKTTAVKKNGRMLAVYASKGGCGASFLAANLAAMLEAPTVLVDLNLRAGDLDVFFGAKPRFSFYDLVLNQARLDETLLKSYLTSLSPQLSLLAAPRELVTAEELRPQQLVEGLQMLRQYFAYVVLDVPHVLDAQSVAVLDQADEILLVFTPDILSARGAQRALSVFKRLGYPSQKIKLVVNRWSKKLGLPLEQVEQFLGEKVVAQIANDYVGVIDSINQGQPVNRLAPASALAQDLRRLAALCGAPIKEADAKPRNKLFAPFLRRQAPTTGVEGTTLPDKV